MSVEISTWAWQQATTTAAEKLVLLRLADQASTEGYCWPSVARVAEFCGITPRALSRIVARLEATGLVRRDPRPGRSNGYWVGPAAAEGVTGRSSPGAKGVTGGSSHPRPVGHPTPDRRVTQNLKGTVREPSRARARQDPARPAPPPLARSERAAVARSLGLAYLGEDGEWHRERETSHEHGGARSCDPV